MIFNDLFITMRPRQKVGVTAKSIVRGLKRATHPYDFVCNLHHSGVCCRTVLNPTLSR